MKKKPIFEFQKISDADMIKIFCEVGAQINRILEEKKLFHTIYFLNDAVVVNIDERDNRLTGGFQIRFDELSGLKNGDGVKFLHDRVNLGINAVLGEQKTSGESQKGLLNISKLIEIRAAMTERASKAGPQHAWWDLIFDINAAIDGKPTMSGKNLLELLEYSSNLLEEK